MWLRWLPCRAKHFYLNLNRSVDSAGFNTWTPGIFARCGDGTCDCCPYGYHIDLDFVRFCESLKDSGNYQSYLEHLQQLKRDKREQRKALQEVMESPDILFSSNGKKARPPIPVSFFISSSCSASASVFAVLNPPDFSGGTIIYVIIGIARIRRRLLRSGLFADSCGAMIGDESEYRNFRPGIAEWSTVTISGKSVANIEPRARVHAQKSRGVLEMTSELLPCTRTFNSKLVVSR